MGRVVAPGPLVKKLRMKSSRLMVKASKAPAATPGRRMGQVTKRKV